MLSAVNRCAGLQQSQAAWVTTFDTPKSYALENGIRGSDFPGPLQQLIARTVDEKWRHLPGPALVYGLISAAPLTLARLDELGSSAGVRVALDALRSGQSQAEMLDLYEQAFGFR